MVPAGSELHVSFLPKPAPNAAGNGVHIHFSLHRDGQPVTAERDWLTEVSAPFVQGILDHAETAVLFNCPSANSYLRLRPNNWVGPYVCAGLRNREAMIRVVPRQADADGRHPHASLEYRTSDGTANAYLALAALIGTGLDGLKRQKAPIDIGKNPELLGVRERERLGLRLLPQSLPAALTAFDPKIAACWMEAGARRSLSGLPARRRTTVLHYRRRGSGKHSAAHLLSRRVSLVLVHVGGAS